MDKEANIGSIVSGLAKSVAGSSMAKRIGTTAAIGAATNGAKYMTSDKQDKNALGALGAVGSGALVGGLAGKAMTNQNLYNAGNKLRSVGGNITGKGVRSGSSAVKNIGLATGGLGKTMTSNFGMKSASEEIDDLYKFAAEYKGPKKPDGGYAIPHGWERPIYSDSDLDWLHEDLGYPRHYKPIASDGTGNDLVVDMNDKDKRLKFWDHEMSADENIGSKHLDEKDLKHYYSTRDTKYSDKLRNMGVPSDYNGYSKAIENLSENDLHALGYGKPELTKGVKLKETLKNTGTLVGTGAMLGLSAAALASKNPNENLARIGKATAAGGLAGGGLGVANAIKDMAYNKNVKGWNKKRREESINNFKNDLRYDMMHSEDNDTFLSQYK